MFSSTYVDFGSQREAKRSQNEHFWGDGVPGGFLEAILARFLVSSGPSLEPFGGLWGLLGRHLGALRGLLKANLVAILASWGPLKPFFPI